ncbi:MAG: hypothetical protein HN685_02935, partial [Waddliaceae bacterium]|nr:hypothetical protein [Waddliaceae bacterium]
MLTYLQERQEPSDEQIDEDLQRSPLILGDTLLVGTAENPMTPQIIREKLSEYLVPKEKETLAIKQPEYEGVDTDETTEDINKQKKIDFVLDEIEGINTSSEMKAAALLGFGDHNKTDMEVDDRITKKVFVDKKGKIHITHNIILESIDPEKPEAVGEKFSISRTLVITHQQILNKDPIFPDITVSRRTLSTEKKADRLHDETIKLSDHGLDGEQLDELYGIKDGLQDVEIQGHKRQDAQAINKRLSALEKRLEMLQKARAVAFERDVKTACVDPECTDGQLNNIMAQIEEFEKEIEGKKDEKTIKPRLYQLKADIVLKQTRIQGEFNVDLKKDPSVFGNSIQYDALSRLHVLFGEETEAKNYGERIKADEDEDAEIVSLRKRRLDGFAENIRETVKGSDITKDQKQRLIEDTLRLCNQSIFADAFNRFDEKLSALGMSVIGSGKNSCKIQEKKGKLRIVFISERPVASSDDPETLTHSVKRTATIEVDPKIPVGTSGRARYVKLPKEKIVPLSEETGPLGSIPGDFDTIEITVKKPKDDNMTGDEKTAVYNMYAHLRKIAMKIPDMLDRLVDEKLLEINIERTDRKHKMRVTTTDNHLTIAARRKSIQGLTEKQSANTKNALATAERLATLICAADSKSEEFNKMLVIVRHDEKLLDSVSMKIADIIGKKIKALPSQQGFSAFYQELVRLAKVATSLGMIEHMGTTTNIPLKDKFVERLKGVFEVSIGDMIADPDFISNVITFVTDESRGSLNVPSGVIQIEAFSQQEASASKTSLIEVAKEWHEKFKVNIDKLKKTTDQMLDITGEPPYALKQDKLRDLSQEDRDYIAHYLNMLWSFHTTGGLLLEQREALSKNFSPEKALEFFDSEDYLKFMTIISQCQLNHKKISAIIEAISEESPERAVSIDGKEIQLTELFIIPVQWGMREPMVLTEFQKCAQEYEVKTETKKLYEFDLVPFLKSWQEASNTLKGINELLQRQLLPHPQAITEGPAVQPSSLPKPTLEDVRSKLDADGLSISDYVGTSVEAALSGLGLEEQAPEEASPAEGPSPALQSQEFAEGPEPEPE